MSTLPLSITLESTNSSQDKKPIINSSDLYNISNQDFPTNFTLDQLNWLNPQSSQFNDEDEHQIKKRIKIRVRSYTNQNTGQNSKIQTQKSILKIKQQMDSPVLLKKCLKNSENNYANTQVKTYSNEEEEGGDSNDISPNKFKTLNDTFRLRSQSQNPPLRKDSLAKIKKGNVQCVPSVTTNENQRKKNCDKFISSNEKENCSLEFPETHMTELFPKLKQPIVSDRDQNQNQVQKKIRIPTPYQKKSGLSKKIPGYQLSEASNSSSSVCFTSLSINSRIRQNSTSTSNTYNIEDDASDYIMYNNEQNSSNRAKQVSINCRYSIDENEEETSFIQSNNQPKVKPFESTATFENINFASGLNNLIKSQNFPNSSSSLIQNKQSIQPKIPDLDNKQRQIKKIKIFPKQIQQQPCLRKQYNLKKNETKIEQIGEKKPQVGNRRRIMSEYQSSKPKKQEIFVQKKNLQSMNQKAYQKQKTSENNMQQLQQSSLKEEIFKKQNLLNQNLLPISEIQQEKINEQNVKIMEYLQICGQKKNSILSYKLEQLFDRAMEQKIQQENIQKHDPIDNHIEKLHYFTSKNSQDRITLTKIQKNILQMKDNFSSFKLTNNKFVEQIKN